MESFIAGMPIAEKERGGMEWCKPCILKEINRI
jgi:hypothetical protein